MEKGGGMPKVWVDPNQVAITGLSSGAYMTVQMHVAYSKTFTKGAGVVAGGPFYCSRGNTNKWIQPCMQHTGDLGIDDLEKLTRDWAAKGLIDDPENLGNSKVYLFSGKNDMMVNYKVMNDLENYYNRFMDTKKIYHHQHPDANHAIITDLATNHCPLLMPPYLSRCADLDSIGEMLEFLFGTMNPRSQKEPKQPLKSFSQDAFGDIPNFGFAGYLYVPANCEKRGSTPPAKLCKLLVAVHGCGQSTESMGSGTSGWDFVKYAGYNYWADTNDIVILYPQIGMPKIKDFWEMLSPGFVTKAVENVGCWYLSFYQFLSFFYIFLGDLF